MCIALPFIARVDSRNASETVGWLTIEELKSSEVTPLTIAINPYWTISDAEGPKTCITKILSVTLSAVMLTDPTDSPIAKALPLARKGKEPIL